MYTNSDHYFQYIDQLDGSWAVPSPQLDLYTSPPTIGGPAVHRDHTHTLGFSPTDFLLPSDCTRIPQRWSQRLPHLAYIFRTPSDPDPPTGDDIHLTHPGCYKLSGEYRDVVRKFVRTHADRAANWHERMSTLGFNVHGPPDDPFPSEYLSMTLEAVQPSTSILVRNIQALLLYAFLCRGYARWMSRRYIFTLAHEIGKPAPCFGVDKCYVGAVFRAGDLSSAAVLDGMKTLERDGVPVFVVRVWKEQESHVWNKTGCHMASLDGPTTASGPEMRQISISIQRSYRAVGHPSPWFSRPPNGYPGISKNSFDEVALIRGLRKKYPDHDTLALDTGAFEVVAHLLGPGPFFSARGPAPSSSFLSLVDASTRGIQSVVSQAEWLDPLPTYSTLDELGEPHLYRCAPLNIQNAVRGMISCNSCDSYSQALDPLRFETKHSEHIVPRPLLTFSQKWI